MSLRPRDQTTTQQEQKKHADLCSFITGITQGSLFIIFSLHFYGSEQCIILKKNALVFGIILLIGCLLTLLLYIFQGSTNVCAVSWLRFWYILCHLAEFLFYFIVFFDLFNYEDCGGLRIFVLVFYISSLFMFFVFILAVGYNITEFQTENQQ